MAAHVTLSSSLLLLLLAALWAPGSTQEAETPPPGHSPEPAAAPIPCPVPCLANQQCKNGACVCADTFVLSSGECIPGFGVPCDRDQLCKDLLGGYALCENKKCACRQDSVLANNTCFVKRGLDEKCQFREQCTVEHSTCLTDVCLCTTEFVPLKLESTNSCIPVVNTHRGVCNITTQCQKGKLGAGSTCVGSSCICENEYYYDKSSGKCLRKNRLEEKCDVALLTGCYLEGDGDMQHIECSKGVCKCLKGYPASPDKQHCGASAAQLSALTMLLLFVVYFMK